MYAEPDATLMRPAGTGCCAQTGVAAATTNAATANQLLAVLITRSQSGHRITNPLAGGRRSVSARSLTPLSAGIALRVRSDAFYIGKNSAGAIPRYHAATSAMGGFLFSPLLLGSSSAFAQ